MEDQLRTGVSPYPDLLSRDMGSLRLRLPHGTAIPECAYGAGGGEEQHPSPQKSGLV